MIVCRAMRRIVIFVVLGFLTSGVDSYFEDTRCVELPFDLCSELNYNSTIMPNIKMQIKSIEDASRLIREFSPLYNIDCYENLKYFICNTYAPTCYEINTKPTPVYPCRHVCEEAREKCEPIMLKHGAHWPKTLDCLNLAEAGEGVLCGSPPDSTPAVKHPRPTSHTKWVDEVLLFDNGLQRFIDISKKADWTSNHLGLDSKMNFQQVCEMSDKFTYFKKETDEQCLQNCNSSHLFKAEDKKFSGVWIATWSIVGFISTLLTIITFAIEHSRFKYPERTIIFLSFCYNLHSVGFLIRVSVGYGAVICESTDEVQHMASEGLSVTTCTLVFFFLYFFGMASALWWVILSFTWFLSASRKWGHEAIERYSSFFHAVAWIIPTVQTIVALVTKKVDTDRLAGLCFVGNNNSSDLMTFVIMPLLVYLLIGAVFIGLGFISLVRIRKVLRRERNTNKLERLIVRIGVFSVLYLVPASIVVGCFISEYNRLKKVEEHSKGIVKCIASLDCLSSMEPKVEFFYLRYFMMLVVAVTSGVWIWTGKTLKSWKKFFGFKKLENVSENGGKKRKNANRSRSNSRESNHLVQGTENRSAQGSTSNIAQQAYRPLVQQNHPLVYPAQQHIGFKQSQTISLDMGGHQQFRRKIKSDGAYSTIDQNHVVMHQQSSIDQRAMIRQQCMPLCPLDSSFSKIDPGFRHKSVPFNSVENSSTSTGGGHRVNNNTGSPITSHRSNHSNGVF